MNSISISAIRQTCGFIGGGGIGNAIEIGVIEDDRSLLRPAEVVFEAVVARRTG